MKDVKFRPITPECLVSKDLKMVVELVSEISCPAWTVKVYHWMLDGPRERSFSTKEEATHFMGYLTNVDEDN